MTRRWRCTSASPCWNAADWTCPTSSRGSNGGRPPTTSYEDAVRAAVDLGGDTDTVAAVTGGLAGAVHGFDAIPARWTKALHVPLPGEDDRVLRLPELVHLARRLADPSTA